MPRISNLLAKTLFIGGFALGCSDDSGGAESLGAVSFAADIHPIFVAECGECHSVDSGEFLPGHAAPDAAAAYAAATADGADGEMVYERILFRINPDDPSVTIMPLGCGDGLDDGSCLTTAEYELIAQWIEQGTLP